MPQPIASRTRPSRPVLQAIAAIAFFLAGPAALQADEVLPEPAGAVLLTVSGVAARSAGEDVAKLDLAMLEALPVTRFRTSTIWTEGVSEFTGVALGDLLTYLGAEGTRIEAVALNDYKVTIPFSDAVKEGPIVAYRVDGALLKRREKGPLWVVYPYDANPDYQTEVIYSRSIWQLDRIVVGE